LEHTADGAAVLTSLPTPPSTLGELVQAGMRWTLWLVTPDGCRLSRAAVDRVLAGARAADALRAAVPRAWKDEAIGLALDAAAPRPSRAEVEDMIARRLGWRLPGRPEPVPLAALTVQLATQLQLLPLAAQRADLHAAYIREALGVAAAPPALLATFSATLERAWHLRWYNVHKETLWRLALDGVGQLGSCHVRVPPPPCACGAAVDTPRLHAFWDCPVAAALRAALDARLGQPVSRAQLWLLLPPAGVQQPVWDVVALAALSALEVGRRRLRSGHAPVAVPAHAVGDFWGRVRSYVALGQAPDSWSAVSPLHPFIGRSPDGRLVLNQ
jgi:hypothetical protein